MLVARGKFIRKVNGCLDRLDQDIFGRYLTYFVNFLGEHCRLLDDFYRIDWDDEDLVDPPA